MSLSISNSKDSRAFVKTYVLALVFGLALSTIATELQLRRNVLPYDTFAEYKERFLTSTAATAAFGDSHVARSLEHRPDFDNFGQASDNLETVQAKLEYQIARGYLKRVIFQADAQIFAPYRINADQSVRIESLFTQKDPILVMLYPEYRQYLMEYWWATIKDPMSLVREREQAYETEILFNDKSKEERERDSVLRAQLHSPANNIAASDTGRSYAGLVAMMQEAGVEVCMVTFPLSTDYRVAASSYSAFSDAYNFFEKLASKFDIVYQNYFDSLPDNVFGDPDHLHPNAAGDFTSRVLADCFYGKEQGR